MPTTEIESDPLFTLLTDALRAGPSSPQWQEAVAAIEARGDDASQLRAIADAREHLQAGQSYRSVRPGPNFTRSVMSQLDASPDGGAGKSVSPAWIATISGLAIALLIAAVIYVVLPSHAMTDDSPLASTVFATPVQSLRFDTGLPEGWAVIGSLPLEGTHGLQMAGHAPAPAGGGIYWSSPIPANQPAAIEIAIHGTTSPATAIQLFVTDTPDFSPERGSTSHELAWQYRGTATQLFLPGGLSIGPAERVRIDSPIIARFAFNQTTAMLVVNGKQTWLDTSPLAADKPKYVGVRLIGSGAEKNSPVVNSVRVLEP